VKIDAHQHFWHYTPEEYGWIGAEMAVLQKDCLPGDLEPLLESVGLEGTVAVQARQTLQETQWLLELADQHPFIKGVVGWVDLCGSDVQGQLERFCAHPKFCGVRHVVEAEPDDRFMLREDFLRGLQSLADFDLPYDILIYPRHLPVACKVVEQFPDQPFVLDHIAKPLIKDSVMEPWSTGIQRLAAYPNVFCKVSGMVREADWDHWQHADFRPYLDLVFEAFGPTRIMYGSDWPVCTVAGTYADQAGIVSDYVRKLSEKEQADVWGGTAQRFYGCGPGPRWSRA
jgi:L-fuconolactonase